MPDPFAHLSDQARLWVYAFAQPLTPAQEELVRQELNALQRTWNSHGSSVRGAHDVREARLVLLAAELATGTISGCGIDSSVRVFKALRQAHGLDALNHHLVHYRDGERLQAVSRAAFQALVDSGRVTPATPVIDLTLTTVGELRAGRLEAPMAATWHSQAFAASAPPR